MTSTGISARRMGSHFQGTAIRLFGKESGTVFRFAIREHAERFMQEFGGEPMRPSERGKGKHWAQWKKGTYVAKPRNPYDFSED